MPPTPDGGLPVSATASARAAGDEPLPGYVLSRPLGRGGFGEVWACTAPGGLKKAVKFVTPGEDGEESHFRQELDAFEQIKEIRHPFLLSLERVEVVRGELIMVMELADQQLQDRFADCRAADLRGIPRAELVGYLAEAAEALDVISARYGLQHLDVKPANLFVTAGHVKVGDYGLVARLDAAGAGAARGLTPKYAAPEVLNGSVHTRSDQYSLALVYCELLTGSFPYQARTAQQMMIAHVSSRPDVSALPACDQGPVWTALQKKPEDRFASCQDFIRALRDAAYTGDEAPPASPPPPPPPTGRSTLRLRPGMTETTAAAAEGTGRHPQPAGLVGDASLDRTAPLGGKPLPRLITTPAPVGGSARLITPGSRASLILTPAPVVTPAPGDEALPLAEPEANGRVRVKPIRSVIPAAVLRGETVPKVGLTAADFAQAVVQVATGGAQLPQAPGDLGRTADGHWVSRFPSTVPAQVVPLKLSVLRETWAVSIDQPEPDRLVLRRSAGGGGWFSKKKAAFEVEVRLPKAGKSVGELTATSSLVGEPDRQFLELAQDAIPRLLADVRRSLGNVEERRKHPRVPATFTLAVHPLHSDGSADPPVRGECRDVSAGGAAFTTQEPLTTRYAYLEFDGIPGLAGMAVLVRVVRAVTPPALPPLYGVQYRTDL